MHNIHFIRVKTINRNILFTITMVGLKPGMDTPSDVVMSQFFYQYVVVNSVKIFLEVDEDTNS